MKLATVEIIKEVKEHPYAQKLDIVKVLNYECVVGRDQFKEGDYCVLIQPDSVLPESEWAEPFRKFSKKRVKAAKVRGIWSFGIVLPLDVLGERAHNGYVGEDFTEYLGITKYEEPTQEKHSIGGLPYSMPKTDEERWQNLEVIPYGEQIEITHKVDGQSATYFYKDGDFGVCGRSLRFDPNADNPYTRHVARYNIREKLERFCVDNKVNLALRGESYGRGIQTKPHNFFSKIDPGLSFYSVYLIDEMRYARLGDPLYFYDLCRKLDLPAVTVVERGVLTEEMISKYDSEYEELFGQPFEGVVVNGRDFSFKIINKHYDSK